MVTVLLVEDDPAARQGLELALRRLGYGVRPVGTGEAALREVRAVLNRPGVSGGSICWTLLGARSRLVSLSRACLVLCRQGTGKEAPTGPLPSHARHLAEELPPLRLAPVLAEAQEQFRGPALRVVHFLHHAGHAPRDPSNRHCHAPLLLTGRLCGRILSIAVRPLAPHRANALIPARYQP